MNPKFKDLLAALTMAAAVAGAALGHAQAKAGPLDQGPHILVGAGPGVHSSLVGLAVYASKEACLAARDDLRRQVGSAYTLACIPGRNM